MSYSYSALETSTASLDSSTEDLTESLMELSTYQNGTSEVQDYFTAIETSPPRNRRQPQRQRCSKKTQILVALIFVPVTLCLLTFLVLLGLGVVTPDSIGLDSDTSLENNQVEVNCNSDEYRCDNKLECINKQYVCDGENHCSDLSDEKGCDGGCQIRPSLAFHCSNGNCIKKSWQCDRETDCPDGDDELNCDKCVNDTQYTCRNFDCIDRSLRCDGKYDCRDRSDEYKCFEQESDTLRYLRNGTWLDVCYTPEIAGITDRLCAQLGQRSEGASSTPVPRDNNNIMAVQVSALPDQNETTNSFLYQDTMQCKEGINLKCKTCGESTKHIWAAYLVGGNGGFPISDYPWHVKLVIGSRLCGGTILSDRWILTAAHCVANTTNRLSSIKITYGTNKFDGSGGADTVAQRIIIHPKFYVTILTEAFSTYNNDIALIEVRPMSLSLSAQPICLPTSDDVPTDWTTCYITGFGDITKHPADLHYPKVLQEGKTRVWSQSDCQMFYNEFRITLTSDEICAGYNTGAIDSCGGDSGGPLACFLNNRWVLLGIVSWGVTCYQASPSIYARVAHAIDWIDSYVN